MRLRAVLEQFMEHGLKLKPSKCNFFCTEISYLGHKVSAAGMEPGTDSLKGITEIAPPCHLYSGTKVLGRDGVFLMLARSLSSLFADPERIMRRFYVFAEDPCKSTITTSEPCSPVFKEAQPRPSRAVNQFN